MTNATNTIDELVMKEFMDYWGIQRLPFPKISQPGSAFIDKRLEINLTKLKQMLCTRETGVVVGEAGSGKSTLLEMFLNQVSVTRYRLIHIPIPQAKPRELYRSIASAVGVNTSWFGADATRVADLLTYSYIESNRPNLIMIDEAHILNHQCLNELRLLTNATVKHESIITMILFGQPSLATTLKLPAMIPLAQRIGTWITMEGLTEKETGDYIDWHMKTSGCNVEIFTSPTKKAIYRRSQGIPRMINRLALECLNEACLEGERLITEELFARVCKNLGSHLSN
jgi:type II secretory pathway predicted ATPase ExeA